MRVRNFRLLFAVVITLLSIMMHPQGVNATTDAPTVSPTTSPTASPTTAPTAKPTASPTTAPTAKPTATPTYNPTGQPTAQPSAQPSTQPTSMPSTTMEGSNLPAVTNATVDVLQAAMTGSVSAVAAVIDSMGAQAVLDNNFAYTALVTSIFNGHENIASLIVTKTGMNINQQGVTGNTPLMWACEFGNYDLVLYFLNLEADYNLVNNDGKTAIQLAAAKGYRNIVTLMRSYGVPN
jgi:cytoskeletal protein RodZ